MAQKRIYQIAKELNISHVEIINFLKNKSIEVANHMAPVDNNLYDSILMEFSKEKASIERLRKERARQAIIDSKEEADVKLDVENIDKKADGVDDKKIGNEKITKKDLKKSDIEDAVTDDNKVSKNDEKEIIGTLQLTFIPYPTYQGGIRAQIEAVRIHNNFRGKGFGKQLFEWAINRSRQKGAHLVQLTTDKQRPDAIEFYKALGFKDSHIGMKLHL